MPARYEEADDEVAARMEAQLERFAPGFVARARARRALRRRRASARTRASSAATSRGGTYELDQLLVFRPAPELCRYRTPLRGLYVAGASVHPGGAVHGMSGAAPPGRCCATGACGVPDYGECYFNRHPGTPAKPASTP